MMHGAKSLSSRTSIGDMGKTVENNIGVPVHKQLYSTLVGTEGETLNNCCPVRLCIGSLGLWAEQVLQSHCVEAQWGHWQRVTQLPGGWPTSPHPITLLASCLLWPGRARAEPPTPLLIGLPAFL